MSQATKARRTDVGAGIQVIDLNKETRPTVPTVTAAVYLNRTSQTLRVWAMRQAGPILPRRINGRLAWPVAAIRRLVLGEE